jgi:hypothetical protein
MKVRSEMRKALRGAGLRVLNARYSDVRLLGGQGVQEGTRVAFTEAGRTVTCAIKVTSRGRISFARKGAEWGTLSQVDRVLYVRSCGDDLGGFEAQMHSRDTLIAAFNQNQEHTASKGIGHLPAWLNADREAGDRFVGSGFGKDALWSESGKLSEGPERTDPISSLTSGAVHDLRKVIQEAKKLVAAAFGVGTDAIDIVIRA